MNLECDFYYVCPTRKEISSSGKLGSEIFLGEVCGNRCGPGCNEFVKLYQLKQELEKE